MRYFYLFVLAVLFSCQAQEKSTTVSSDSATQSLCDFVNPFIGSSSVGNLMIGTTSGGNTYPGAVLPFGMASVSPHTDSMAPSGYYHGKEYIYGFGHVHLSGVGCQDLGNIVLMPSQGKVIPDLGSNRSKFNGEVASPGYYKVDLDGPDVTAEMTATIRSGLSKYTFHAGGDSSNIIIDLTQGAMPKLVSMPPQKGAVKIISDTEVEGFNYSGDFCYGKSFHAVYFVAQFSKPAVKTGTWKDKKLSDKKENSGDSFGAYFTFKTTKDESVLVKVGVSYVSIKNARENLNAEQNGFEFEKVWSKARAYWEKDLSKVKVEGGSVKQKQIFYTGLYHMLMHPNVFSDVNGEYQSMRNYPSQSGGKILKAEGYTRYTVFSLWDTYRNVHPFFSLVYPERQRDMVMSLVGMYEESGRLPKWELAGGETFTMVGDPSLPVIADAYIKGIKDFDTEKAFEAMMTNASQTDPVIRPGLRSYLKYRYIPMDDKGEWLWGAVSTTLEYNFADWSLAQYAKALGKEKEHEEFLRRSMFYRNLYDPRTGFLRPKMKNGAWYSPFNPDTVQGTDLDFPGAGGPGFVEGNAWHYKFFVPHDIPGLISLMGGEKKFVERLNECFEKKQYNLWNEPDMAYPFLYAYVKGEAWRTQKEVRNQMETNFDITPSGIPGNDDCGTISAFYVLGAIGFYPSCPASEWYEMCSPVFDKITIQLNPKYYKGKEFIIETKNNSRENIFIQSSTLNGKMFDKQQINHRDIVNGGKLILEMGAKH